MYKTESEDNMKRKSSNPKNESGQSLVELALSFTVILILLTGAVDFSLALFQYVTIHDAAQEGALYGSINPQDETGMEQRAIAAADDVVQLADEDITVAWSNSASKCEGSTSSVPHSITVTVTSAHPIMMPFITPLIGTDTINLTASVTDTILQPACS
jgi:Flp pilus assembly protein TadG